MLPASSVPGSRPTLEPIPGPGPAPSGWNLTGGFEEHQTWGDSWGMPSPGGTTPTLELMGGLWAPKALPIPARTLHVL